MTLVFGPVRAREAGVVVIEVTTIEQLHLLPTLVAGAAGSRAIVVSALTPDVALLAAMAAGARAFLLKPVDEDLLERTVPWVLAGHTVVDPRCTDVLVELALHGQAARLSSGLSLRQSQVLALARGGLGNREIAEVLGLSLDTVKSHMRQAMRRLGVHDRWSAGRLAARAGEDDPLHPRPHTAPRRTPGGSA